MRWCRLVVVLAPIGVGAPAAADGGGTSAGPSRELVIRVPRVPRPFRTERWAKARRHPGDRDAFADVPYSQFHQRIGYRKAGDPEIERQSIRFTRDLVADLRDAVRVACGRARCSQAVLGVAQRASAYLADRAPRYALAEHDKVYNHWNWGWVWHVTAGGVTFEAGCNQMREARSAACWLSSDVDDDLQLIYTPRTGSADPSEDIALEQRAKPQAKKRSEPLGKIAYSTDGPRAWLTIDGLALAPSAVREPSVR
jgi:hypothetical protein